MTCIISTILPSRDKTHTHAPFTVDNQWMMVNALGGRMINVNVYFLSLLNSITTPEFSLFLQLCLKFQKMDYFGEIK